MKNPQPTPPDNDTGEKKWKQDVIDAALPSKPAMIAPTVQPPQRSPGRIK